jgi:hypothetical protein
MGLNPIPVLEMDALSGPALFGVWRPRLLFPAGLAEQLSDEELRLVVLHELGHLKRRDLFLQGLLVVSQAVHWFNPLVWLAGRLAREDRELACDEFVMAHTSHSGSHAYAKTLLRVLGLSRPGRPMLPAVGILETKNQIKQRIIMITKYQSTNARRLMLGTASILAVSAGLLMVNAAESGSNASTPAAAAATETETATPAMPNKISITPKNKNTFKNGDGIEIKEVLGSVPNFQVGGTYRVKGICRQQTLDSAELYMGNTIVGRTGEGDFGQNAIIPVGATWLFKSLSKGSTEFEYVFKLLRPGTLHITIYDGGGNAYAGINLGAVRQQTQDSRHWHCSSGNHLYRHRPDGRCEHRCSANGGDQHRCCWHGCDQRLCGGNGDPGCRRQCDGGVVDRVGRNGSEAPGFIKRHPLPSPALA